MSSQPVDRTVDVVGLYAAHRLALVRLAVLLVDDLPLAEDVVQDAFLGAWRNAACRWTSKREECQ